MIPPLNVALKICQQLVWIGELVVAFLATPMPVVTLACLVVITKYANLVDHVRQSVLKGMRRSSRRFRKAPKHEFSEPVLSINDTLTE